MYRRFYSTYVVLPEETVLVPALITVSIETGLIESVERLFLDDERKEAEKRKGEEGEFYDLGDLVIMPGVVDSNRDYRLFLASELSVSEWVAKIGRSDGHTSIIWSDIGNRSFSDEQRTDCDEGERCSEEEESRSEELVASCGRGVREPVAERRLGRV